jgi:hypothetical protein
VAQIKAEALPLGTNGWPDARRQRRMASTQRPSAHGRPACAVHESEDERMSGWFRPVGRKGGGRPIKEKKLFFFLFPNDTAHHSILSNQKSFSSFEVIIKVVQNLMIYNFAKRSKVKIPTNFEIGI